MKRMIILSLVLCIVFGNARANEIKTSEVYLTIDSAERIFVNNNMQLLAQHFNIESQKGLLYQSKLFNNPNLSYSQGPLKKLNISGTDQYTSLSHNPEVSYTISQLITTAGKRYNQIKIAENNVSISQEQYFDLLRTLKLVLRSDLINCHYNEQLIKAYQNQKEVVEGIIKLYEPQVEKQNISKKEYVRMSAELLSINSQLNDLQNQNLDLQLELSNILGLKNVTIHAVFDENKIENRNALNFNILDLTNTAFENRPDLKIANLTNTLNQYNYKYQKSLSTPDVNVFTSYDKQGSYVNNFTSLGVSFDLPLLNRNKGNIISSKNVLEQSKALKNDLSLRVENQIANSVNKIYAQKSLLDNALQSNVSQYEYIYNQVFENYKKRNISTLEYLDFLNAYLEHQNNIINAKISFLISLENLNFITGTDLKNK